MGFRQRLGMLFGLLVVIGCPAVKDDDDVEQDDDITTTDDDTTPGDDDSAGDDDTSGACNSAEPCPGDHYVFDEADLEVIVLCESISGNLNLTDLDGLAGFDLPCLTTVDGIVMLSQTEELASLDGLSSLSTAAAGLGISDCASLLDLDGLSSLVSVGGLLINNNAALRDLDGLFGIATTALDSGLTITGNPLISNLDSLVHLECVSGNLTISDNDCLSQEEAEAFAASLDVEGDIVVQDNGANHPCD